MRVTRIRWNVVLTCSSSLIAALLILSKLLKGADNKKSHWITNECDSIKFHFMEAQMAKENKTMNKKPAFEHNLLIQTRKLNILAVQRMNQIIKRFEAQFGPLPCSKWWSNPMETYRNEIVSSGDGYDDQVLEFEAESSWEKTVFQAFIRVYRQVPEKIELLTVAVLGPLKRQFRRNYVEFDCFAKDERRFGLDVRQMLNTLCSCDLTEMKKDKGYKELPSWPKTASFLVTDYLNMKDSYSLFEAVPTLGEAKYCDPLKMLIMVSSAPNHFERRQVIRETYGSLTNYFASDVKVVFLFGQAPNEWLREMIETEIKTYSDIILANFADSYHNLTLSHLSMYAWIFHTCSGKHKQHNLSNFRPPKHVLKADDDFFLNIDLILRIAEANPEVELIGDLFCQAPAVRQTSSHIPKKTKYYTPRYMYMGNTFPAYLNGVAYLIRADVIPKFLEASLSTPIIHMDDVYITGLLARELGIFPRHSKLFGYARARPEDGCQLKQTASLYVENDNDLRTSWTTWNSNSNVTGESWVPPGPGIRGHQCSIITQKQLIVNKLTSDAKRKCMYS